MNMLYIGTVVCVLRTTYSSRHGPVLVCVSANHETLRLFEGPPSLTMMMLVAAP